MAIGFPVRNMGRMQRSSQRQPDAASHMPAPEQKPMSVPPPVPSAPPEPEPPPHGTERHPDGLLVELFRSDRDALLLIGLLLLLRREHSDQKLLLALLYILL